MLGRTALEAIADWKTRKTHQALLIDGARQVGKTTLVREFARTNYGTYVEINFFENPDAIPVISLARNTQDLLLRITALTDTPLVPNDTIVFFDEIQEFGDILTWAKFLEEEGSYDYVFSGSLLGVDLFNVRSWPVGFMGRLTMFPLTFEEFCSACGVPRVLLDTARDCLQSLEPVPDFVHNKLMELHAHYLLVGGLPEAVQRFVDTNDLMALRAAHEDIFDLYEYNIVRHMSDVEGTRFTKAVYESIPGQLNKENKRFKYANLGKSGTLHKGDLRFSRLESSFDWLGAAGVALPTIHLDEPRFPLGLYADRSKFKLYYNDVGLLMSRLSGNVAAEVLRGRRDLNYGSPYENFVAQELRSHGHELYYYQTAKRGEVDFVLQDKSTGDVSLVEVKSGKSYKRHVALKNLLEVPDYQFANAYILCNGNIEQNAGKTYLPIYMAGWL